MSREQQAVGALTMLRDVDAEGTKSRYVIRKAEPSIEIADGRVFAAFCQGEQKRARCIKGAKTPSREKREGSSDAAAMMEKSIPTTISGWAKQAGRDLKMLDRFSVEAVPASTPSASNRTSRKAPAGTKKQRIRCS